MEPLNTSHTLLKIHQAYRGTVSQVQDDWRCPGTTPHARERARKYPTVHAYACQRSAACSIVYWANTPISGRASDQYRVISVKDEVKAFASVRSKAGSLYNVAYKVGGVEEPDGGSGSSATGSDNIIMLAIPETEEQW